MVTEETVEEIIYETGQRKQRLTKAVLSDHSYQENPRNGEGKDGEGVSGFLNSLSSPDSPSLVGHEWE